MQPIIPDRYVSHRERIARDAVMDGVRKAIWNKRLTCEQIRISDRPLVSALRARILRSDYDGFSLKRAFLLADATGVDDITLFTALCPGIAPEKPLSKKDTARFEALMADEDEDEAA